MKEAATEAACWPYSIMRLATSMGSTNSSLRLCMKFLSRLTLDTTVSSAPKALDSVAAGNFYVVVLFVVVRAVMLLTTAAAACRLELSSAVSLPWSSTPHLPDCVPVAGNHLHWCCRHHGCCPDGLLTGLGMRTRGWRVSWSLSWYDRPLVT